MATVVSRGAWRLYKHHELVDRKLVELVRRKMPERILVIEFPPRHGKSEHASHYLPAWVVTNYPHWGVGLASYESKFARTWGRKARQTYLEAQKYTPTPIPLDRRRDAANEWGPENHPNGGMFCSGVGGPFTGRGFKVVIVDDPIKNAEQAMSETYRKNLWEWYNTTVETRLEPDGVVVVMQTRWHKDDLIGKLLKRSEEGGDPVHRLHLPAIAGPGDQLGRKVGEALWPDRWGEEDLDKIRIAKGPYWWNSLYQQRPTQHESAEWPEEYFDDIWADDWPDMFEVSTVALDPSKGTEKGDFSAIAFAGLRGGKLYIDSDIARRPSPDLVPALAKMVNRYRPDEAIIESNSFQDLLLPEFLSYCKSHGNYPCKITAMHNSQSKVLIRIRRLGGYLSQNRIKLRRGNPHNELLLQQLRDFPLADYDDGPDALEMAVRRLHDIVTEELEEAADARYN